MNNIVAQNPKREAPWIGIGTSGMWDDYREALYDSKLDFNVVPKDAKVEIPPNFCDECGCKVVGE